MRKISPKQKAIAVELKKIKLELYEEQPWCTGCGSPNNLTLSHRIPRSRRKDLATDKANCNLLCMSCHIRYESRHNFEWMNDYQEVKDYIEMADYQYFMLCYEK